MSTLTTKEVDDILSRYGHGLGVLDDYVMSMIDKGGLRPGDPPSIRRCADSLFHDAEKGVYGQPVVKMADMEYDMETAEPLPFGHLPDRSMYCSFDLLPWMGIAGRGKQPGSVNEIDIAAELFSEEGEEFSEEVIEFCESNKTATFEPISNVASDDFKDTNDARRSYEATFQKYAIGNVLIAGCGADPLATTFDFSKAHVTYLDMVNENLLELEKRLVHCNVPNRKLVLAEFWEHYPNFKQKSFSLIIFNHSIHHVTEGSIFDQYAKLKSISELLTDNGALIGVGPSLSGLISTPKTNDIRNRAGLLGIFKDKKGVIYCQSQIGNHHFTEPVFFSSLLYKLEEEKGGTAHVGHMSSYHPCAREPDIIRMYEWFNYIPAKKRPKGVQLKVQMMEPQVYNPLDAVKLKIIGRDGTTFSLASGVQNDIDELLSEGIEMTRGTLMNAQHIPKLLYQGPFLVSEKLDGVLGRVSWDKEAKICLLEWQDKKIHMPYSGRAESWVTAVEVIEAPGGFKIFWLETSRLKGHMTKGWIGGIRSWLPEWMGFKDYYTLDKHSFIKTLKDAKEGIVALNPHDRLNVRKPQQLFYKHKVSVDFAINKQIFEMTRDKIAPRYNHEANGLSRLFEAPFLINSNVVFAVLCMRAESKKVGVTTSADVCLSLEDIFSYPVAADTTYMSRERNTAIVQLWRGGWGFQDDVGWGTIASTIVPAARHRDWGVFGILFERSKAGEYDKDHIFGAIDRDSKENKMTEEEADELLNLDLCEEI